MGECRIVTTPIRGGVDGKGGRLQKERCNSTTDQYFHYAISYTECRVSKKRSQCGSRRTLVGTPYMGYIGLYLHQA